MAVIVVACGRDFLLDGTIWYDTFQVHGTGDLPKHRVRRAADRHLVGWGDAHDVPAGGLRVGRPYALAGAITRDLQVKACRVGRCAALAAVVM